MRLNFISVERRVVSQLALAHETDQLGSGSLVRLYTSTLHSESDGDISEAKIRYQWINGTIPVNNFQDPDQEG